MKTAVVWITYMKDIEVIGNTYEYATIGETGTYLTLADFLVELKKLAKSNGCTLHVNNVVVA